MKTFARLLLTAACAVPMVGCVAGQTLDIDYQPTTELVAPDGSTAVLVTVEDQRPFVVSGDKGPYYVGHYRAGFGNPWDVTTEGREPLADIIEADLVEELEALGFMTEGEGRKMAVTINDWNFDGYQNGHIWYDIAIVLTEADGTELYTGSIEDDVGVTGTLSGIKGGMERDMPQIYRAVILRMVRDNDALMAALKS